MSVIYAFLEGALVSLFVGIFVFLFKYLPNRKYNIEMEKCKNINYENIPEDICAKCSYLGATKGNGELRDYLHRIVQEGVITHEEAIGLFHSYKKRRGCLD